MFFSYSVENYCLAQARKLKLLAPTWKSNSFVSDLTFRSIQLNLSSESLISFWPWYSPWRSRINPDIMQAFSTRDSAAVLLFSQYSSSASLTAMPVHRHLLLLLHLYSSLKLCEVWRWHITYFTWFFCHFFMYIYSLVMILVLSPVLPFTSALLIIILFPY